MMRITQGLKRAVQVNGHGIATIDIESGRTLTWKAFAQQVAQLAGALSSLGLEPEDRVAILSQNSDHYLAYYFATIWAGGIVLPINTRLAPPEVGHILTDASASILVVDDALQGEVAAILTHTSAPQHIIFAGDGKALDGFIDHKTLLNIAKPIQDVERGGNDIACLMYTSGTTGHPKGAMLTHSNIISNALSALAIMYEGEPWNFLHTAPMFHIADNQWNTGVTLQAGTHLFVRKFVPEQILKLISEYHITHTALVPTMISMLCQVPDVEQYDLSSLKKVNFGGSPITPMAIKRAREVFPGCEFIQGYGQTETAPNISMLLDKYNTDEGPYAGKIESAGQPVFSMEVRIVDNNDKELPIGAIGEITARGPHVMAGYWNKHGATRTALRGGWMHTGDIGYIDEDGFIFIVDRLKDMIVSGGENVYSTEVENVIYEHPAVSSCAVIGIPHPKWGESVHAVVHLKEGHELTEEALLNHCRQRIARYKCPRSIEIREEPLPLSGSGKILKKVLRAPYWKDSGRQVN